MARFKVGDRFVLNKNSRCPGQTGAVEHIGARPGWEPKSEFGQAYMVKMDNPICEVDGATDCCMDPLLPPREDLQILRWEDCPWQPERVDA